MKILFLLFIPFILFETAFSGGRKSGIDWGAGKNFSRSTSQRDGKKALTQEEKRKLQLKARIAAAQKLKKRGTSSDEVQQQGLLPKEQLGPRVVLRLKNPPKSEDRVKQLNEDEQLALVLLESKRTFAEEEKKRGIQQGRQVQLSSNQRTQGRWEPYRGETHSAGIHATRPPKLPNFRREVPVDEKIPDAYPEFDSALDILFEHGKRKLTGVDSGLSAKDETALAKAMEKVKAKNHEELLMTIIEDELLKFGRGQKSEPTQQKPRKPKKTN